MPDAMLASMLGVDASGVSQARIRRGIRPYRFRIDWDAQPLGRMTDPALAAILGVSIGPVNAARRKRGIPAFRQVIKWDSQPLGDVADRVLAKRLGVAKSSVVDARQRRGIGPYEGPKSTSTLVIGARDFWDGQPLGVGSDQDLASRLGYCETQVARQRLRRGIPSNGKAAPPCVLCGCERHVPRRDRRHTELGKYCTRCVGSIVARVGTNPDDDVTRVAAALVTLDRALREYRQPHNSPEGRWSE